MKIASTIARYLLGLGFLFFGLNGLFHFLPNQPMPAGPAGDYIKALMESHYMLPVSALEVIAAALLIANRYVPLALTILGPILVNILLFHIFMLPMGLPMAFLFVVFWFLVFVSVRPAFDGLFQSRA